MRSNVCPVRDPRAVVVVLVALAIALSPSSAPALEPDPAQVATGRRGIAATVHPLATQAALDAFAAGGNAIDAAVAAGVTLGVVDSFNSGLGGGCFILVHTAAG
ncbi:MAG: gamma-glutamyltransferase, partial [Planctomycetes bacterium]|nr:gamma-glutamyltransferase [Planctomycetota bacterium]